MGNLKVKKINDSLNQEDRDAIDEMVLTAKSEGKFFKNGKDAKGAVKVAMAGMLKEYTDMLKDLEKEATKQVAAIWK